RASPPTSSPTASVSPRRTISRSTTRTTGSCRKYRSPDQTGIMRHLFRLLFAVLLLTGLAGVGHAAEEIRSFDARLDLAADGTLTVTERIVVNVEGNNISRGIFRDIPLRYEDASGRTREVR